MNFKFEDMEAWEIPLPTSLDEQTDIIAQIEKQKAIIEGARNILENIPIEIPTSNDKRVLRTFVIDTLYGISSKLQDEGKYPVLRMNNLDTKGIWYLDNLKYTDDEFSDERKLSFGDFIFNRTNSVDLVGKSSVIDFDFNGTWAGYLIRLKFNGELNPFYLKYLFATDRYRALFRSIAKPAGGQANINVDELTSINIDYFDSETQRKIVAELDAQMQVLEGLRTMKMVAEKKIEKILAEVWGIESTESDKPEVKE
jgi:type I restriction enzyme S subunit